jgi:isopentenyl-diphosphate delta-isomerase
MAFIGHTADEMISMLNEIKNINPNLSPKDIIISGGVANSLDGHYLKQNLNMNSVIGFAKNFLLHAEDYDQLREFFLEEISALKLANCFLRPKDRESFV